jgi:hypothetical protein
MIASKTVQITFSDLLLFCSALAGFGSSIPRGQFVPLKNCKSSDTLSKGFRPDQAKEAKIFL